MAGFALLVDVKETPKVGSLAWVDFVGAIGRFKGLDKVGEYIEGDYFVAAKFDTPASLHQGITLDSQTGSWLMAVGTVVDHADINCNPRLDNLLQDYLIKGTQVFSRLDGQFALIVYHAKENSLSIISDPFGLIPIYYGTTNGGLYLSTSALAVAKAIHSKPEELELRSFLLYGDTLKGSFWEGVHVLQPANTFIISPEKTSEHVYWSFLPDQSLTHLPMNESVDCVIEGLSQSTKVFSQYDQPAWISLTGGLDSRTLAAIAHFSHLSFRTYCHGPSDSRDVRLSALISQQMGWGHEYFALPGDWGTQRIDWLQPALGQTDGNMNVLKMSRIIREQTIKVHQMCASIWGYGGEIYRGYYWKQELWKTGKSPQVDYERLLDYRVIPLNPSILYDKERWQSILREAKKRHFRSIGEKQPDLPNTAKLDLIGIYLERHSGGNTIAAILGQQRILLPYYSKDSITKIISINHRWRKNSLMFRLMLERIHPKLAGIEISDGGPALPMRLGNAYRFIPFWLDLGEKLLWKLEYKYLGKTFGRRRDAGPAGKAYPTGKWLRETISQLPDQSLLSPDKMLSAYLYDREQLQSLLDNVRDGRQADETLIGRILTVEMAMRAVNNSL